MNNSSKKILSKIALALVVSVPLTGLACSKASKKPQPTPKPQAESKAEKSRTPVALTYASDIKPILTQKCVNCHKPDGPASNVPLDTYSNVMKYVTPNDPGKSKLVQAVDGGSMSSKANSDDVKKFKDWVSKGAKE